MNPKRWFLIVLIGGFVWYKRRMGRNRCGNIQKGLLGKHFQFTSAVSGSRSHQLGKPSQEESMWDFLRGKKMEDLVSVIGPESFRSSLTKGLIDLSQYWVWQLDCAKINLDETRPCQAATAISYLSFGISLIWIRFCPNKRQVVLIWVFGLLTPAHHSQCMIVCCAASSVSS